MAAPVSMEGRLMEPSAQLARNAFDLRQKRLFVAAWAATLLPLAVFGYLTWQSVTMHRELVKLASETSTLQSQKSDLQQQTSALEQSVHDLNEERDKLQKEVTKRGTDLTAQRATTTHYRNVAGIRVQFYRESDRQVVMQALSNLGFKVDPVLAQSTLIHSAPDTIAFGKEVAQNDLREIASALVNAEFPLKRITPAERQRDPKMIQIYASASSAAKCGLLKLEDISAGRTCGALAP
jgi:cell division protein FtsB